MLVAVCCFAKANSLDAPIITPIDEFFVLNEGSIPSIPDDWHLTVEGAVGRPLSLNLDELAEYPAQTQMATLECAIPSGRYLLVGNANWTGVALKTIIQAAKPVPEAASVKVHAMDGYSKGDYDINDIMLADDIILAYGMNGETLPVEQGYPLRLVVPGAGGFHWVQWVERIEVKTSAPTDSVFYFPNHARIFEPIYEETIAIGTRTIRGMALAGEGSEITKVQISTDNGATWQLAKLLTYFVPNVWKHWEFAWESAEVGPHQLFVRTEDDSGSVQAEDGPYGWRGFAVPVTVEYDDDSDGVADSQDNCASIYNPSQGDADADGIGNACDEDCPNFDGLSRVGFLDFSILAGNWKLTGLELTGDLSMDAVVDIEDLAMFMEYWLSECSSE